MKEEYRDWELVGVREERFALPKNEVDISQNERKREKERERERERELCSILTCSPIPSVLVVVACNPAGILVID